MEINDTPGTCDRCCRLIKPVLVLDGGDLGADCMDEDGAKVYICRECLREMLDFIGDD